MSSRLTRGGARALALPVAALALVLHARPAAANPHTLAFTYPWETLGKGQVEVEQYVDIIPIRVFAEAGSKATVVEPRYELTTEFEYGITDRLELGLYLAMKNAPEEQGAGSPLAFDGVKQRLRYRIGKENELPVDISLYLEIEEMHDALEIEEKVNLQKRFGPLKAMINLWAEQEFARDGAVLNLHPTGGLSYQLTPNFSLGIETWTSANINLNGSAPKPTPGSVEAFNMQPHQFLGPSVAFLWDKLWWAVSAYGRLDDASRPMRAGEELGHLYVRSIVGLSL